MIRTRLEVFVEGEVSTVGCRRVGAGGVVVLYLLRTRHDAGLLVLADALLEEVGLALERDHVHEVEGILDVVDLGTSQGDEKSVRDKRDVLRIFR